MKQKKNPAEMVGFLFYSMVVEARSVDVDAFSIGG